MCSRTFERRGFFAEHDDLRPGFNDVTWAKKPEDVLDELDAHPQRTMALSKPASGQDRCHVLIGAQKSGIQVRHVRIMRGGLPKSEVHRIAASTPFVT